MYAGGEEGFIGIDVSEADNDGLIEEEGFDHSPTAQKLFEIAQADAKRFGAEICHCPVGPKAGFGPVELEAAEAPDVAEVKHLLALLEFQAKMRVAVGSATGAGPSGPKNDSRVRAGPH